jgi:hypothetical protein
VNCTPELKMQEHLCFDCFELDRDTGNEPDSPTSPEVSTDLGCCKVLLHYTVQLQCLRRAPGCRATEKAFFLHKYRSVRAKKLGHSRGTQQCIHYAFAFGYFNAKVMSDLHLFLL